MDIYRAGSRANRKANPDWFVGNVWQEPIVETPEPARARAVRRKRLRNLGRCG